jgi:hypothetical protein
MTTRILPSLLTASLALAMNLAHSAPADAAPLRNQNGPYELQVLVGGSPARTFYHDGETYLLGQHGDRYTLRVVNHSARRIEAVVSVDGRDVVDGRPGDYQKKRGYLVDAYGQVDIEGWRLSQGQAAAFRFSTVADSYAARTGGGREVGVIGVAVFPENYVPPRPVYVPPHCCVRGPFRDDEGYSANQAPGARAAKTEKAAPPAKAPSPAAEQQTGDSAAGPADKRGSGALAEREPRRRYERPGLGTAFGEAVDSPVYEVEFTRQNPSRPALFLGVRYNDHDGLLAMGVDVDGTRRPYDEAEVRRSADPFPVADRHYAAPPPGWDGR